MVSIPCPMLGVKPRASRRVLLMKVFMKLCIDSVFWEERPGRWERSWEKVRRLGKGIEIVG